MPVLRVTKNDKQLCVVGSDDVWSFSASVSGDIWGPESSALTVTGSAPSPDGGAGEFLVWELSHELRPSDRVGFSFEEGSTSTPIKKDNEVFDVPPGSEEKIDFSAPIAEDELEKLESRPTLNTSCRWKFSIVGRDSLSLAPDQARQHISLHLLWNDRRPERLRVNLSKSSLREISSRSGGEEVFLEYVQLGSQFEVAVGI